MIAAGWSAVALALITAYALSQTERGPASLLLAVALLTLFLFVCWVFGRRPHHQENPMPTKAVSIDHVRHVLWHFGDQNLGVQPGHFVERLFVLASAADADNLAKLREAFPELIDAWKTVARQPWGLDYFRSLAKAELDRAEQGIDFSELAR